MLGLTLLKNHQKCQICSSPRTCMPFLYTGFFRPQPGESMPPGKSHRNRKQRSTLIPIANHLLNTTGKSIEKTAKWMATDHSRSPEYLSITETLQNFNYFVARQALISRQFNRGMNRIYTPPSRNELVRDWLIDHLLFARDILWGFMKPILENFFYGLLRLIAILLVNFIFFYALFKFITH